MTTIDELVQELEQEARTTRRVLERVPEDRLGWKPHQKSWSLGQLALHVATVPGAIAEMAQHSPFPLPTFSQASPASAAELLTTLDKSIAKAQGLLRQMDAAALTKIWRAVDGDKEVMALPVGALLRAIMLNHWYHHRGQLSVYLRQVGALVPSIYGPSSDENPFKPQPAAATGTEGSVIG